MEAVLLTRQSSGKVVILAIILSMLAVGTVPANSRCTADCCLQDHGPLLPRQAVSAASSLFSDCCSGQDSRSCPLVLDPASDEMKGYIISAVSGRYQPISVEVAWSGADNLLPGQQHPRMVDSVKLATRAPSVPLFLTHLSLLI